MHMIMQDRTSNRRVTLDPFDPEGDRDRPLRTAATAAELDAVVEVHLGCVDWYLYPVSGTAKAQRAG